MIKYEDVRVVHLEISSRCNAACPECLRNLCGGDIEDQGDFVLHDMRLEEAKKLFPIEFLKQLYAININGNYGDFITCRDGLKIVEYFAESNPKINIDINTNASGQPKIWEALAQIPQISTVFFRIDGLKDTHHLYRQYTDFDLIMSNAKKYIDAGGHATWTMIKFDFNEHQIEEARALSQELGFKDFKLVDHGRSNSTVFTRDGVYTHTIGSPKTEIKVYQTLIDMRQSSKENGPDYSACQSAKHIKCKALTPVGIYVQSNGQVYPCCWTGQYSDHNMISPGMDQTRRMSQGTNYALDVGIESAMNWFDKVTASWEIDTVANGRHFRCNSVCGEN